MLYSTSHITVKKKVKRVASFSLAAKVPSVSLTN